MNTKRLTTISLLVVAAIVLIALGIFGWKNISGKISPAASC